MLCVLAAVIARLTMPFDLLLFRPKSDGGAMRIQDGIVTISSCLFQYNSADDVSSARRLLVLSCARQCNSRAPTAVHLVFVLF